jgi:hypothetical protein
LSKADTIGHEAGQHDEATPWPAGQTDDRDLASRPRRAPPRIYPSAIPFRVRAPTTGRRLDSRTEMGPTLRPCPLRWLGPQARLGQDQASSEHDRLVRAAANHHRHMGLVPAARASFSVDNRESSTAFRLAGTLLFAPRTTAPRHGGAPDR